MKLTFTASDVNETEMSAFNSVASLMDDDRHLSVNPFDMYFLLECLSDNLSKIVNSGCGDGIEGVFGWRSFAGEMRSIADEIEQAINDTHPNSKPDDPAK